MQRFAVVCGLLRFPLEAALTLRKLFRLRAEGLLDGIVLSTWTPEIEREAAFIDWVRGNGVTVVHSLEHADRGPTMLYTQARAVWLGLQAVPEGADVLKLRTDKTSHMIDGFVPLLAEGTTGTAFDPGPHAAYARKVAVLWPHVGRPFYFGDQAYFGSGRDVAAALNFDARFHLTMEGLNPETKWWIRPICERFGFWRGYFHNVDQLHGPNFIRAALSTPGAPAPPPVVHDILAATLRGMSDGFIFTVHNPVRAGTVAEGHRYSALFDLPSRLNTLAYEGVSAGRKTLSLRDGASLAALIDGQVDPCPLTAGVTAALARQQHGPPDRFDAEAFRDWVAACAGVAQTGPVAPRPFIARPPTVPATGEADGFLVALVSRAAGDAPDVVARDLLRRLEIQLSHRLPMARALFRAALDMERAGGPVAIANAAIGMAAQQKINEAVVEYALRAVEQGEGVDPAQAERNLAPSCSRGIAEAHVLKALLGQRRGAPDKFVADAMTAARALASLDAAFLDAARAGQAVPRDAVGLDAFAAQTGVGPAYVADFRRRMARLVAAGVLETFAVPDVATANTGSGA